MCEECRSDEQAALHDILDNHRGRDQAISSAAMASAVGISDGDANPTTRFEIRDLIKRTALPVAGCNEGYFVIETDQELNEYVGRLEQRKRGIDERISLVCRAYRGKINQTTLDEVGEV